MKFILNTIEEYNIVWMFLYHVYSVKFCMQRINIFVRYEYIKELILDKDRNK